MKLESKYDIGDKVFGINFQRKQIKKPCPRCNGTGELELKNGDNIGCDKCHNFGHTVTTIEKESWVLSETNLTIGRVGIEMTDTSEKEEYMCVETGVGTGRVWKVDLLYKTKEEAKKECIKRNKELKQKEQNHANRR